MTANGLVIRGETFKLGWSPESSYGIDPGTSAYTRVFGVVQSATMPDPVIDFQPFWTLGTASSRNWYIAYKGKMVLSGSIPDIILLDGRILSLGIGNVSNSSGSPYTHTITESTTLPSIALHVTYDDSSGTVKLMRRFFGGKVSRMTIEASEGDFLKCAMDEIAFVDWSHDQAGEPKYASGVADVTLSYPTSQPYLFSYGSLSLGGTTFARIRNFRLEISNNLEPKYYITTTAVGSNQLPYEYREGHREYRLAVTVDIEDASLYKELIRQGTYSTVYKGFQFIATFTRGVNDTITMTMPTTTPAAGGDAMGCLITRAPHNIVTDPVVSVPLDIIGRNLGIVVVDSNTTYP